MPSYHSVVLTSPLFQVWCRLIMQVSLKLDAKWHKKKNPSKATLNTLNECQKQKTRPMTFRFFSVDGWLVGGVNTKAL